MSAESVTVELGSRAYPVRIGAGVFAEALAAAARDPRWFGLFSLMVQTNAADAVPVPEKK